MACRAGSRMARACSGSRSRINSVEPVRSASNTVTCLRSPSSALGRQDLLGEVGGSVGERGPRLSRCEGGVRCLLTCPDQHRALLIHSTPSDLNKFHLQVVEVRVVKVELALERPVRHTAALAQQCENLIQHRVKSIVDALRVCRTIPGPYRRDAPRTSRPPLTARIAPPLTSHVYSRRCRSTP